MLFTNFSVFFIATVAANPSSVPTIRLFYSGAAVSFRIRHFRYYLDAATFQQKTRLVGGGLVSRQM
jgi:hypothetical protein